MAEAQDLHVVVTLTKKCPKCLRELSTTEFCKDKTHRLGRTSHCKDCARATGKAWHSKNAAYVRERNRRYVQTHRERHNQNGQRWAKNNPEKYARMRLKSTIKRFYGMTLEEYGALVVISENRCGICSKACPKGRRLPIDHDHSTREVRGLLCPQCNTLLSKVEECPDWLVKAQAYLMNPPAKQVSVPKLEVA